MTEHIGRIPINERTQSIIKHGSIRHIVDTGYVTAVSLLTTEDLEQEMIIQTRNIDENQLASVKTAIGDINSKAFIAANWSSIDWRLISQE